MKATINSTLQHTMMFMLFHFSTIKNSILSGVHTESQTRTVVGGNYVASSTFEFELVHSMDLILMVDNNGT